MMIHPICTLRDGTEVYVNLINNSEAARNIAKQPQLLRLVKELLTDKKFTDADVYLEHDLGRVVGYDFVVNTTTDEPVFYAQIVRDDTYTRFIKGGKPLSTTFVAARLRRDAGARTYELEDVRMGRLVPPRPGTANETPASKEYWATHAFVQDGQALQPRTVTRTCPY